MKYRALFELNGEARIASAKNSSAISENDVRRFLIVSRLRGVALSLFALPGDPKRVLA